MHKNAFGGRALPGSAPLSALQTLTKVKSRRRRKNRTNVKMGKTGRKDRKIGSGEKRMTGVYLEGIE